MCAALHAGRACLLLSRDAIIGKHNVTLLRPASVAAGAAQIADASVAGNDAVAANATVLDQSRPAGQKRFRKVNVAMHIGYVGSNYTGERDVGSSYWSVLTLVSRSALGHQWFCVQYVSVAFGLLQTHTSAA